MKSTTFLFVLLVLISPIGMSFGQTTSLSSLKGTKWYLNILTTQDTSSKAIVSKSFDEGEQRLIFDENGEYKAYNLLGLDSLKGFLVEGQMTTILSNAKGSAYYWVFENEIKNTDSLILRFVNYAPSNQIMRLILKPLTSEIEEMRLASASQNQSLPDFDGLWEWRADDQVVTMKLVQNGKQLIGTHCYGKFCYSLSGRVDSDTIAMEILDIVTLDTVGAGKIIRMSDSLLSWTITQNIDDKVKTVPNIQLSRPRLIIPEEKEKTEGE